MTRVSVVMLAYGKEEWLYAAAKAVVDSAGVDVELIVVDNGCISDSISAVETLPRTKVLRPGFNTGFTGGCRLGTAAATGELIAFVNSDAIVYPEALAELATVAQEPRIGAAMASIRLSDSPNLINTAGNPLHFTGMSWAGGNGESANSYAVRRSVPSVSGCCFMMRRDVWEDLGGFPEEYFAYHEDTELSIRLWQRGMQVDYVPGAVVLHHYEFSRNDMKLYLLERNRLVTLLTSYQRRSLMLLTPMLLLTELAVIASAMTEGWFVQKVKGWTWLVRNRRWVMSRRRQLQRERVISDRAIAELMTARFTPTNMTPPRGVKVFNALASAYWRMTVPLLPSRVRSSRPRPPQGDTESKAATV